MRVRVAATTETHPVALKRPWLVKNHFRPGNPGGPGRRLGSMNLSTRFHLEIEDAEKRYGKHILRHFVDRAYKNDQLLTKAVDKVVPNVEGENKTIAPTILVVNFNPEKQEPSDAASV